MFFIIASFFIIFIIWALIYSLYKFFNNSDFDKRNPIFFLFIVTLSSIAIYVLAVTFTLTSFFGPKDITTNIEYGDEIYAAENDGLIGIDFINLYDNNTFSMQLKDYICNGGFEEIDSVFYLDYRQTVLEYGLPTFLIERNHGFHGYYIDPIKKDTVEAGYFLIYDKMRMK